MLVHDGDHIPTINTRTHTLIHTHTQLIRIRAKIKWANMQQTKLGEIKELTKLSKIEYKDCFFVFGLDTWASTICQLVMQTHSANEWWQYG